MIEVRRPPPMQAEPLDAARLTEGLRRMASRSSPGCCGWSVPDARLLPRFTMQRVADLLNRVEETGEWPTMLLQCKVILIPKSEQGVSGVISDLRPLTISSIWHRVWASARLADLNTWSKAWAPTALQAHGRNAGAEACALAAATHIRRAFANRQGVATWSADIQKTFDSESYAHLNYILT